MERINAHKALRAYLFSGISGSFPRTIGVEVETQFADGTGHPITLQASQAMMHRLVASGWSVTATKGNLITVLSSDSGTIAYELGRHNLEVSSAPAATPSALVKSVRRTLDALYRAGEAEKAFPFFGSTMKTNENLLIVPDERDATWLRVDGREALNLLATTSAVQFTVEIGTLSQAMLCLNRLGLSIGEFLRDYPQEDRWRRYIHSSHAGYDGLRYGGPLVFNDSESYIRELLRHEVMTSDGLVPIRDVATIDWSLFVRSVWWYFRFKRYGTSFCLEVRPLPRRKDEMISEQLDMVLDIMFPFSKGR
jgi:hypothetical protein